MADRIGILSYVQRVIAYAAFGTEVLCDQFQSNEPRGCAAKNPAGLARATMAAGQKHLIEHGAKILGIAPDWKQQGEFTAYCVRGSEFLAFTLRFSAPPRFFRSHCALSPWFSEYQRRNSDSHLVNPLRTSQSVAKPANTEPRKRASE